MESTEGIVSTSGYNSRTTLTSPDKEGKHENLRDDPMVMIGSEVAVLRQIFRRHPGADGGGDGEEDDRRSGSNGYRVITPEQPNLRYRLGVVMSTSEDKARGREASVLYTMNKKGKKGRKRCRHKEGGGGREEESDDDDAGEEEEEDDVPTSEMVCITTRTVNRNEIQHRSDDYTPLMFHDCIGSSSNLGGGGSSISASHSPSSSSSLSSSSSSSSWWPIVLQCRILLAIAECSVLLIQANENIRQMEASRGRGSAISTGRKANDGRDSDEIAIMSLGVVIAIACANTHVMAICAEEVRASGHGVH